MDRKLNKYLRKEKNIKSVNKKENQEKISLPEERKGQIDK